MSAQNPAAVPQVLPDHVLALQVQAGNTAVGQLLQRRDVQTPTASESGAEQASPAPAPTTTSADKAAAEAIAVETSSRIRNAINAMIATGDNPTARNTGQLFVGSRPRLHYTPMTPRSDSGTIRAARGQVAGSVLYFFTGTTQPPLGTNPANPPPGTLERRPSVVGTIQGGNTVVIRGQHGGSWRSQDIIKDTLIHEASHILLASYGEHPGTKTDASSIDRYKDEFRAYFVEQFGDFAGIADLDERARQIKRHLVGTGLNDTQGYPHLRTAYWTPPASNPFRTAVDAHTRPDGFNLTNSVRLDRLFAALGPAATDPAKVDDVMVLITRMIPTERIEARTSRLIMRKVRACGPQAARRIRSALYAPTHAAYSGRLNPRRSGRIARLYRELARGNSERIRDAYDALQRQDRADVALNPASMVFVDRFILDPHERACVYAMLVGRSSSQYLAMDSFLEECFMTSIGVYGDPPSSLPDDLRAAVRRITFYGRLALYRMVEDARRFYVDSLPEPVSRPLLRILRGDAEP